MYKTALLKNSWIVMLTYRVDSFYLISCKNHNLLCGYSMSESDFRLKDKKHFAGIFLKMKQSQQGQI